MNAAHEATHSIAEPARNTPIWASPEVLVVGGGAAGIAAACAAARAGASTMLVEHFGFLGGTLTAVTLGGFCGTHAIIDEHRVGRTVGGLYLEIEERLRRRDGISPPRRHGRILGVPYDAEAFKLVADQMLAAYGVQVLFQSHAVAVQVQERSVQAVVFETKGGRMAVCPQVVIDCTGDGDVAALAGSSFSLGEAGRTQFGSTMFRLANVDTAGALALSRADIQACLEQAVSDGYALPRTATGVHASPVDGVVHLNVTRLQRSDGGPFDFTQPLQISDAEREGRRQAFVYEEVFRRYVPGFADARIVDIGAMAGVRETRLIQGEKTLTEEHVRACTKPQDRIACCAWPLEHHGEGRGTQWEFLPDREWYGIPFGCLAVRGFRNLMVAGRNLSATHLAQASARVAGPCFAMGEAAGAAARLMLETGTSAAQLSVAALQAHLSAHGALLTPELQHAEQASALP